LDHQQQTFTRQCLSISTHHSGARLLLVAAQGGDGMPQLLRTLEITPGEGYRQSEFQFFELMFTLRWVGGLTAPITQIRGRSQGGTGGMSGKVGGGVAKLKIFELKKKKKNKKIKKNKSN
jgi:hypothetical protein